MPLVPLGEAPVFNTALPRSDMNYDFVLLGRYRYQSSSIGIDSIIDLKAYLYQHSSTQRRFLSLFFVWREHVCVGREVWASETGEYSRNTYKPLTPTNGHHGAAQDEDKRDQQAITTNRIY